MLRFHVEMILLDNDITSLFQLYKYSIGEGRPTKQGFTEYMRSQLIQFGSGDSLLGEMFEYEELNSDDLNLLTKWKMI